MYPAGSEVRRKAMEILVTNPMQNLGPRHIFVTIRVTPEPA